MNEKLSYMARHVAKAILRQSVAIGNGGFTSDFGPATYGYLLEILTDGNQNGYCAGNGHVFRPTKECCICGITKNAVNQG